MADRRKELQVNMFGPLTIVGKQTGEGGKVTLPRLQQLLIACLISKHGESVSASELIEMLYSSSEEEMQDPLASLRGLIFRLRAQLKKRFGEDGYSFVQTDGSHYRLNPEMEVELDTERFVSLIQRAEKVDDREETIDCLRTALREYRGSFLSELSSSVWVIHQAAYFKALYLSSAQTLLGILKRDGRYEEQLEIAQMVIEQEPLEEILYVYEMEALMGLDDYKGAQECYRKAVTTLFDHLGNGSTKRLEQAHEELMKRTQSGQASINEAVSSLQEGRSPGAFFCDYGVFREIYQLEERRSERLGVSVYLAMISGEVRISSRVKNEEYRRKVLADGMQILQEVTISSLRSGDVLTRYSDSQYLLLLPTCQYETAMKVLERVESAFNNALKVRNVFLHFAIQEV